MEKLDLTPPAPQPASSGNNTHAGARIEPEKGIAFQFEVVTAGATPTVTWKIQGSVDTDDVSDANATWFDMLYVTDATDTPAAAALVSTAVGKKIIWMSNTDSRMYRRFRLVTSANTNITYRGSAHRF